MMDRWPTHERRLIGVRAGGRVQDFFATRLESIATADRFALKCASCEEEFPVAIAWQDLVRGTACETLLLLEMAFHMGRCTAHPKEN